MSDLPQHFVTRPPMPGAEATAAFEALFDRAVAAGPNTLIDYDLPWPRRPSKPAPSAPTRSTSSPATALKPCRRSLSPVSASTSRNGPALRLSRPSPASPSPPEDFPFLAEIRGHDDAHILERAKSDPDGFPWLD